MTIGYLNGTFLPLEKARVSAMDRGFIFGDGVYEVIPAYHGKLFRLEQHLKRLVYSLQQVRIDYPIHLDFWQNIFSQLIKKNGGGDQSVYLQITRGEAIIRDYAFPKEYQPTVFAYSIPLITPCYANLSAGISAITLEDIRWKRCDVKATNLVANILLRQQALDVSAQEAILINAGNAVEGTSSNLFIVQNNLLITPPSSHAILGGVTRDLVLELAQQHQILVKEQDIPVNDLILADEIWLTSSTKEISPVVKLDGETVGSGQAGPLWKIMIQYYQEYKQSLQ